MKKNDLISIVYLAMRLHRQKYSWLIIAVVASLLLITQYDWFKEHKQPTLEECEVLKIYDGDTMTVQCGNNPAKTKIRLYCIDAPEMKQKPWGAQARDYLRSITGRTVRLVEMDKDRYGRTVGEVYNNQVNLNLTLVKAGYVAVYQSYCEKPEYAVAEKQAKSARKKIWSQPGDQQTPWRWRKQH